MTVTSPSLQGSRSAATDEGGDFRLAFLPPGSYRLRAELPGFKAVQVDDVRVGLDLTATVRVRLEVASLTETVQVSAAPSEIDVINTTTGVRVGSDLYTRIPLERSFFATARLAPGSQEDEMGTGFHGSTGVENEYVIDGLNVTGTIRGGKGDKELNFDFVQEIEVKSGGLPAEYGRTTGGILNVLTKSGGNQFHGSAFGFYAGGGLRSDDRTATRRPADTTTVDDVTSRWDFGAELGGRIVQDRLWFFGAYNRVAENSTTTVVRELESPGAPGVGEVVPGETRHDRFAGKLTWRPADSSTVTASVFGDPNRFTGAVAGINGPPSTYLGTSDAGHGAADFVLRYEGSFGGSLLVQALYGQHRQNFTFGGPGTEEARVVDRTVNPRAVSGGIGFYGDSRSQAGRVQARCLEVRPRPRAEGGRRHRGPARRGERPRERRRSSREARLRRRRSSTVTPRTWTTARRASTGTTLRHGGPSTPRTRPPGPAMRRPTCRTPGGSARASP